MRQVDLTSEYGRHILNKKRCLAQIARIARRQTQLIRLEAFDDLLDNMKEREQLACQIDDLDMCCQAITSRVEQDNPRQQACFTAPKKEVMALLSLIQRIDQENQSLLEKKAQVHQKRLRHLSQTRRGFEGYTRPYTNREGSFLDLKQ